MSRPKVILFSGKAQHGKDTAARLLREELEEIPDMKVASVAYGDYVKYVATKYFNWDGEKDEKGRSLLQWVGGKGRESNPNFWVYVVTDLVESMFTDYDFVLVTDCRFPNEITVWEDRGHDAMAIRVNRVGFVNTLMTEEQRNDPSETSLDNWSFDRTLHAKNIEDLGYIMFSIAEEIVENN